jgi:hypothetical protein
MCDVMRQCGAGDTQFFLNHAYRQTIVTGAYQQAHDPESGRITDFGEDIGGVVEFHDSDTTSLYEHCQLYY